VSVLYNTLFIGLTGLVFDQLSKIEGLLLLVFLCEAIINAG
jgi:hypothetical protein